METSTTFVVFNVCFYFIISVVSYRVCHFSVVSAQNVFKFKSTNIYINNMSR